MIQTVQGQKHRPVNAQEKKDTQHVISYFIVARIVQGICYGLYNRLREKTGCYVEEDEMKVGVSLG